MTLVSLFLCCALFHSHVNAALLDDANLRRLPSAEQVVSGAAILYRQRLLEIERRYFLDTDGAFLTRVNRIAMPLIAQSKLDYPKAAKWHWEVHTSSDPDETAYSMAGGKILISQAQVTGLNLSDIELAMLISHEMQHVLQEHNLKEYLEALRLFPAWKEKTFSELENAVDNDEKLIDALATLNFAQEMEADVEGLRLAWRSGLPANRLALFFKKLAKASGQANFDSKSHPAPARRWQTINELAQRLDTKN
jgi:predicted Zn-dependent protease